MAMGNIDEAKRLLKIADHMTYITYPVLKENRLLIKILEQINQALEFTVEIALNHSYKNKKIIKYDDPNLNFQEFVNCSDYYCLEPNHIKVIKQIAGIIEMHNKSPMEFVKQDKFIIMSDNLHIEQLSIERIKIFLKISQQIFQNIEMRLIKDQGFR